MAIKVHHGPPGSYKTSGAVQDDFIHWAKTGRTVITNVRGLTQERLDALHPEWGCELVQVDTETVAGRERMARWYRWAPAGAFLLIDEAQRIFPKRWREKDLAELDQGSSGLDSESVAPERPTDWLDAWTRHRHFNWDLVLTTPHISLMRPDIMDCAEMCYGHKNLAVLGNIPGFKGAYMEAQHSPGTTTRTPVSLRRRTIRKEVWGLYESTATGDIADTSAGQSIWKNPKMVVGFGILAVALVLGGRSVVNGSHFLFDDVQASVAVVAPPVVGVQGDRQTHSPVSSGAVGHVPSVPLGADVKPLPLDGYTWALVGAIYRESDGEWFYRFDLTKGEAHLQLSGADVKQMGYEFDPVGNCAVRVVGGKPEQTVLCAGQVDRRKQGTLGL